MALVSIEQVWAAPQCPTAEKINNIAEGRRKKEEGRRKKEEGRRKMPRFQGD
ncbi:hypothetical protein NDI43_19860 [Microcoleus vaginatus GB2-A3]|uniref:hypothetical protein n=1 Tax=Microcoleus vaginatus TaxID=119532 RepID=UPI0032AE0EEC